MSNSTPSVFLKYFHIGSNLPGGICCDLNLIVSSHKGCIRGSAAILETVTPRLLVESKVVGEFSYIPIMKGNRILVVFDGYAQNQGESLKNFELRMELEEDWGSGTVTYSYLENGKMITVENQKIESEDFRKDSFDMLTEQLERGEAA